LVLGEYRFSLVKKYTLVHHVGIAKVVDLEAKMDGKYITPK